MESAGIRCIAVVSVLAWMGVPGACGMAQKPATASAAVSSQSIAVGNSRYDAEKELVRLGKRYGLTDAQKAKIQPILVEQQKQVHSIGEEESLSNSEWAAAVNTVHRQTMVKIKLELTDSQASKYAKDEANRAKSDGSQDDTDGPPDGPPPGGGPGGGGGGPPGE